MTRTKLIGGVYHPRSRGGAMSDALADARRALARLTAMAALRGAGFLLLACAFAALVALATYSSDDASLNNANGREVANWLGPLGATAADLLLQSFGFAALAALAPLFAWGARALTGRTLKYAMWRALAWPLGTVTVAAGLGVLPAPNTLPAGAGGLIGIAAHGLSAHVGQVYGRPWIGIGLPLLLLLAGLPLAFLATGLRFVPFARAAANIPASLWWLGGKLKLPSFRRAAALDEELDEHETEAETDDGYHLDIAPHPATTDPGPTRADTRLAGPGQSRSQRRSAGRECPHVGSGAGRFRGQGPHQRGTPWAGGHLV